MKCSKIAIIFLDSMMRATIPHTEMYLQNTLNQMQMMNNLSVPLMQMMLMRFRDI